MIVLHWLLFILITAAILYGGSGLSRYGDIIAEKSGLGRMWVGVVLMASVTSLPELVTGISAVLVFDTPDIAVGNVLGACMINFLIIALLDLLDKEPVSGRVHEGHILSAAFVIILASLALSGILGGMRMGRLGWIGPYSLLIFLLYLVSMRLIFFYERRRIRTFTKEMAEALKYESYTLPRALRSFAMNSAIVFVAALWLPYIGEKLAAESGLGESFVGSIFIALSTTLPELVVSVSAMRLGASDMAVGNILGSNLFNLGILSIDDFLYTKGPLLAFTSPSHGGSALSIILMSAIVTAGVAYRAKSKRLPLSWDSIALVLVYVLNMFLLYSMG